MKAKRPSTTAAIASHVHRVGTHSAHACPELVKLFSRLHAPQSGPSYPLSVLHVNACALTASASGYTHASALKHAWISMSTAMLGLLLTEYHVPLSILIVPPSHKKPLLGHCMHSARRVSFPAESYVVGEPYEPSVHVEHLECAAFSIWPFFESHGVHSSLPSVATCARGMGNESCEKFEASLQLRNTRILFNTQQHAPR